MARGKIVIITGIPGVGKSTVLNGLVKLAEEAGRRVQIVNYGTVMVKVAGERGETLHRDLIRRKSISFQHKLQTEAAREIARMAEGIPTLIVDTHMMVRTEEGYLPGLPSHVLAELKPDLFILIEADPGEIFHRRTTDVSRMRDKLVLNEIIEELGFSRAFASACGTLTGAPVKIIQNPTGKQMEAARKILELLEGS